MSRFSALTLHTRTLNQPVTIQFTIGISSFSINLMCILASRDLLTFMYVFTQNEMYPMKVTTGKLKTAIAQEVAPKPAAEVGRAVT